MPPTTPPTVATPVAPTCGTDDQGQWYAADDLEAVGSDQIWAGGWGNPSYPSLRVTRDAGQTWSGICGPEPLRRAGQVARVVFRGRHGVAVGASRGLFVVHTADGGDHWVESHIDGHPAPEDSGGTTSTNVADVVFGSDDEVWLVAREQFGSDGPLAIYHSTDAGRTFSRRTSLAGSWRGSIPRIRAVPGRVWVLGHYRLASSKDDGVTWEDLGRPAGSTDLAFLDDKHGVAVGDSTISRTTDGGRTWMRVVDPRHPVQPGEPRPEGGTVAATGGPPPAFTGISVAGRDHLFVLGSRTSGSVLYASEDGGQSWHEQGGPISRPLWTVAFSDPKHGYAAVSNRPCLLVTTDGGLTWQPRAMTPGTQSSADCV